LTKEELKAIEAYAEDHVGPDPFSANFVARRKAIAFIFVLQGKVYSLEQDFFRQSSAYNDVCGGAKRTYSRIHDDILQNSLSRAVLNFVDHFKIPDKSIMLLQFNMSIMPASDPGKTDVDRLGSIVGQGIHTDGCEEAMLLCTRRSNVEGAMNQYFGDLYGKEPLCEPRVLQEGDLTFFKDNELFHYVTSAGPCDPERDGIRTVLLLHHPADHILTGDANPSNILGTRTPHALDSLDHDHT